MAPNTRSPRQALDWMPLEIVPGDSERGYATVQLNPETDPETGTTTYYLNGYSPNPTVGDGYRVSATIEVAKDGGAKVTRLVFEPSPTITTDDGHRPREPHEARLSPITSSVVSLVKFTAIVKRLEEVEEMVAGSIPEYEGVQQRLDWLHRRRPRKNATTGAEHAEQALAAMQIGRGYQARLQRGWGIGLEGVKKRVSRLRDDGWLHRDYGRPGETLIAWRAALVADDSEPSLDSKED